jgi:hypothetical protein
MLFRALLVLHLEATHFGEEDDPKSQYQRNEGLQAEAYKNLDCACQRLTKN